MLDVLNRRPRRILMTVDAVGGVWTYPLLLARSLAAESCAVVLAGLGPEPTAAQAPEVEAAATLDGLRPPPNWMAARQSQPRWPLPQTLSP